MRVDRLPHVNEAGYGTLIIVECSSYLVVFPQGREILFNIRIKKIIIFLQKQSIFVETKKIIEIQKRSIHTRRKINKNLP